ncbi:ATP-dependent DNA helicase PIF1-like [Senna tora]|uniref:ATP-dependent DNA helicase n=1 Tax=Senna tora TaxID=362788 RepID=A0A834VYD5_9FABA|nr:ATP-dependent DNA helicase PIF1-like [Senna tora]
MAHRFCFEASDRSLRDIIGYLNMDSYQNSFGGKVIIFCGDFRQILLVIPRGSRQDIVLSYLDSSYLWESCKVLILTKNMRLGSKKSEGGGHVICEEVTYLSSDNICVQQKDSQLRDVYTTEFLSTISGSGLPYHELKLKVGAPVMLLRNIENSMGLCNGTRLTVKRLCTHVIEASILSGKHAGERIIIACMKALILAALILGFKLSLS